MTTVAAITQRSENPDVAYGTYHRIRFEQQGQEYVPLTVCGIENGRGGASAILEPEDIDCEACRALPVTQVLEPITAGLVEVGDAILSKLWWVPKDTLRYNSAAFTVPVEVRQIDVHGDNVTMTIKANEYHRGHKLVGVYRVTLLHSAAELYRVKETP